MRAMVVTGYGDPDVIEPLDVPDPEPGVGQVRVRVRAAGVQPWDVKLRRGDMRDWKELQFPYVLGNDFAGVVDACGPDAGDVRVGDEVLGFSNAGAYAEAIVVPHTAVAAKPAELPWEVAGAMSASGQTAYNALQDLSVSEGDVLLVHAAAGGVGTFAVQLARHWGATVVGTASAGNADYLRSLGAIPVKYGPGVVERVRAAVPKVDVVLDCVGGDAIPASLELGVPTDRIGTIADFAAAERYGIRRPGGTRTSEKLAEIVRLYEKGVLQVPVRPIPLEHAAEAHRIVERGHGRGKVVLVV